MDTNDTQPVNEWNAPEIFYVRIDARSGGVLSPRSLRLGTPPRTGSERIRVDYQVVGGFWKAEEKSAG